VWSLIDRRDAIRVLLSPFAIRRMISICGGQAARCVLAVVVDRPAQPRLKLFCALHFERRVHRGKRALGARDFVNRRLRLAEIRERTREREPAIAVSSGAPLASNPSTASSRWRRAASGSPRPRRRVRDRSAVRRAAGACRDR
jgi:hypothetical protein